jgi:hypothetical protein
MDQDTFVLESGNPNFEIAQDITNVAQQSGYKDGAKLMGIKIGISLLMISGSFSVRKHLIIILV